MAGTEKGSSSLSGQYYERGQRRYRCFEDYVERGEIKDDVVVHGRYVERKTEVEGTG